MSKAVPDADHYIDRSSARLGCWLGALFYGAVILAIFAMLEGVFPRARYLGLVFLIPAILFFGWELYEVALLAAAFLRWRGSDVRALLVYSKSPKWQDYIEANWRPRMGSRVATLDWSERKRWKPTLPVRLFRKFGGLQDFNPIVIVLDGLRSPEIFRFYQAFRDAKHGNTELLGRLEEQMFEALDTGHER